MKLIILRSHLKQGFSYLERIVVENPNLPIIKNIVIKAETAVVIQGTNLEIGVTYTANAKILEPGSLCVPFAPLHTIIQNTTSERITLETAGNTLSITTDNYHATIQGVSTEEFPIIPKIAEEHQRIEISGETLQAGLEQVVSAAATNDLKPELNSILFALTTHEVVCAATDGFRLAEKRFSQNAVSLTVEEPTKALVPLKTALEMLRIFGQSGQCTVRFDEHQVSVADERATLISRLIDGSYPDYQSIIPKTTTQELVVDKNEFSAAIKLVSNFSGRSSDVKLRFSDEGRVELFAANQLVGENAYAVEAKKQKGATLKEVSFNWRYFFDGIKSVQGDAVFVGFTGEMKPALIKGVGDDSFVYIVMPVQQ